MFQVMESSLGASAKRGKLVRTISKILHLRTVIGIATDVIKKRRIWKGKSKSSLRKFEDVRNISDDQKIDEIAALEALLARLFASISSIKASYAQLQLAHCPYDGDEIRSADHSVISELISLSEMKQCFVEKQFDFSPEKVIVFAEIQEQYSAMKIYEITKKRLETQSKFQDSEIERFKALLEECNNQNLQIQRKLNESGHLSVLDNVHPSGLNPSHFINILHYTVRSIRSFVRMLVNKMYSAGWDLKSAAGTISSGAVYCKDSDYCFAFESFVSRVMFDGFQQHQFFKDANDRRQHFYKKFNEIKSANVKEYLSSRPDSTFGKFCQIKYLTLIHPEMELSLCGDLKQREFIKLGKFPETAFFGLFAEMAKRVWMLHCLGLSFDSQVSIFQIRPGSRYSEVYMESVTDQVFVESETDLKVAFTVVPGFKFSKTVVQCQVYLLKI